MPDHLPIRADLLLIIIAAALYLIDTAQLLFANEILFVREAGRWRACLPRDQFMISRRFLFLPAPFMPDATFFRARWPRPETDSKSRSPDIRSQIDKDFKKLTPVKWLSVLLLPEIFLVLPAVYVFVPGYLATFVVLLLIYHQALAMVLILFLKRRSLGLDWSVAILLGFESLICVPYAINLYRKTAQKLLPGDADVLELESALLTDDQRPAFRQALTESVNRQLEWVTENSEQAQALVEFRTRCSGEDSA